MLEEPALLVCSWAAEGEGVRKRLIRAAATGRILGFARAPAAASWWPWLSGRTVQVFETEDASLLATLEGPRGLRRTWDVLDADTRRVGFLYRGGIWRASGGRLGIREPVAGGKGARFLAPDGAELATIQAQPEQNTVLRFKEALEGKPFDRMLLLAEALTTDL
jgi:hypothetical protein